MKNSICFMFCIFLILIEACNPPKYQVFEGYTQGTTFRIVYQSNENFDDTIIEMHSYVDKTLSTYKDSSMISCINKNDSNVVLNDLFIQFYQKSREVFEISNGYFDLTVAPLVQTWSFVPKEFIKSDCASIDSPLKFFGMNKIKLENKKILQSDSRMQLDGNAIAQGQSVDYVSVFIESKGTKNYMVEIGGELRAEGINEKGESWKIRIDKPIVGSDKEILNYR